MTKIKGGIWNRAKVWQDHCFIDQGDSNEWAGNKILPTLALFYNAILYFLLSP